MLTKNQCVVCAVGCSGILASSLGLILENDSLNYFALLIGRLSAILYLAEIEKFRVWLLAPISISLLNAFYQTPTLFFLETLIQAIVYQASAILFFTKLNKLHGKDS
jgi:hypothetical protein